jgi:HEAT repeat protein
MVDARSKRRVFLLAIVTSTVAMVGFSGWLLWPVWKEHQAVQRLLHAVRMQDQDAVDSAVAEVQTFRWKGVDAITELLGLLTAKTGGVRWRATYSLGEMGEAATELDPALMRDRAVPALIAALSDEHVRIRAAYALGQIGPEARAAIPDLMKALEHEDQYFNGQAGHALARIGEPAVESLLEAAANGSNLRSLRSIDVLGEIGPTASRRSIPALAAAFRRGNADIKSRSAAALSNCGRPAVPQLIQLLREHAGAGTIATALGEIGPAAEEAIPSLLDSIAASGPYGDTTAAAAVGRIGGVLALVKALDQVDVRFSVLQALTGSGPAAMEAIPKLLLILKTDERPHVRNAVTWVFRNLGPDASDAVPALVDLLAEQPADGNDIRYSAVAALERIGPAAEVAAPALVKLVESDGPDQLRFAATIALSSIDADHPALLKALIRIFKQPGESYHKYQAIQALEKLGPEAAPAVPLLIEELKGDRNSFSLATAIQALGAIGPDAADAVPALIELLKPAEPPSYVQTCAVQALGAIGPRAKTALPQLMELAQGPNKARSQVIMREVRRIDPDAAGDGE